MGTRAGMTPGELDIETLIETWRGPLVGLLAGWGVPWNEAQELAQDTLVEAYLGRERLRGDASDARVVGPWLRGIARHLFAARGRRHWRRRETELQAEALPAAASEGEEDASLVALRRAMDQLPERHRLVLYLHYLESTPVRQVAALLGTPESTVEGRLHRARKLLRERVESQLAKEARS